MPQQWFLHFYIIGSACCVTLLALVTALRSTDVTQKNGQSSTQVCKRPVPSVIEARTDNTSACS